MSHAAMYTCEFYKKHANGSSRSAGVVVPIFLSLCPLRSVVDVGCGVGAWAREFLANGVPDVLGIDGDYVQSSQLCIPQNMFLTHDLLKPLHVGRGFDAAVCLEVAEHLPDSRAGGLVEDLTSLAPCVLFSAAIPGQGGIDHIIECAD